MGETSSVVPKRPEEPWVPQRSKWLSAAAIGFLLAWFAKVPSAPADPAQVAPSKESGGAVVAEDDDANPEMQGLFATAIPLLPLAMDQEAWSSPEQRIAIGSGLDQLAQASAALGQHAVTRDLGFRNLSDSLAEDIERTRNHYAEGAFEESRASMVEIANTCAACHSRLSGRSDTRRPPLPDGLLEGLSLHEQSQVWVATRRFDKAMAVWEAALADEMQAPGQLDIEGYLLDYMTIGLRVLQEPARVRSTFAGFSQRPDMPIYLQRHLARWAIALDAIEAEQPPADPLVRARELAGARGVPQPDLLGREQTVYDLAASSLLLGFIDDNRASPEELSEAYYLLGVVEARSVDSYWLPQAESHLEAAIRLAPGSASAASAYALLEEYVVVGFGGADGDALPDAAFGKLQELEVLIEKSRAPGSPPGAGPPAD